MDTDALDIRGTVGQQISLQLSSGALCPSLNSRLRIKEAESVSARNRERTDPQINEDQEDNAEEEEEEQADEATLTQNKDYRVNIKSQFPVQENLGTKPQNYQSLNTLSQMQKDNSGLAPVWVQKKPKKGKGNKKTKSTEGLNASNEPSQGSDAQTKTKTASTVLKTKATLKTGRQKN
ncbi:MAG: hypothetical protein EZS28_012469 [Streblomastix strix]|uniref:Uncharacterized protein n=1 Tax=Streblomastix strix TaxID=222440 RepID=A0A5J4WB22_9EUKA|nr:MAG: hypothetical protein EZS28_012469 [Streblomastix strix]